MNLSKTIKTFKPLFFMIIMVLLTFNGFSQDPGDTPDGAPPAVPFEDYMHLIIIAIGAIIAFVTINKLQKKNA